MGLILQAAHVGDKTFDFLHRALAGSAHGFNH